MAQPARYLQNPHGIDPSGRMPSLLLSGQEATDVARYLCKSFELHVPAVETPKVKPSTLPDQLAFSADDKAAVTKLPEPEQWRKLGESLVASRRCNACHKIEPNGKPLPASTADWGTLSANGKPDEGCLSDTPPVGVPAFGLGMEDRHAIAAYLKSPPRILPSPAYEAKRTLERFNCLACHAHYGQGGLTTAMTDLLRSTRVRTMPRRSAHRPLLALRHRLQTNWMARC